MLPPAIILLTLSICSFAFGVYLKTDNKVEKTMSPWSERKGFAVLGDSNDVTFVKANIDMVSDYLATKSIATTIDALGKEIEIDEVMTIVFQIRDTEWTTIVDSHLFWERDKNGYAPSNQEISEALSTEVVRCSTSDTVDSASLTIHYKGQLVFDYQGGIEPPYDERYRSDKRYQCIESTPYEEEPDYKVTSYFLGPEDSLPSPMPDKWRFIDDVLAKKGLYQAGLTFSYFFDHEIPANGKTKELTNKGIEIAYPECDVTDHSDLSRIDCFTFKQRFPKN